MKENQNIEWKQIWKDDYLRWICAFANSKGGLLYIGVDDTGKVLGVENTEELVYNIPHKVKDSLGIVVQTSIKKKKNKEYICIKVEASPYPVNYKGRYYIRSGSNTYEAKGVELDRLLLKRIGTRWEKLPGHKSTINDLDNYSIDFFKEQALKNKKLTNDEINISILNLLRNLRLYNGKELSLAAILLFGKDPENWVYNSHIKICEVNENGDIIKESIVKGSLISQLYSTLETLYRDYKINMDKRIIKELVLNSIMHKSYDEEIPTEIKIYENKITIFNMGEFPKSLNTSTIYNAHASIPYNPRIANAFNKCGITPLWGQGIGNIKKVCNEVNTQLPKYKINSDSVIVKYGLNTDEQVRKLIKER